MPRTSRAPVTTPNQRATRAGAVVPLMLPGWLTPQSVSDDVQRAEHLLELVRAALWGPMVTGSQEDHPMPDVGALYHTVEEIQRLVADTAGELLTWRLTDLTAEGREMRHSPGNRHAKAS